MLKNKLAHVAWECKYHVVILPKYRYKVFNKELKEALRDGLKKLSVWLQIEILEGHIAKDHVYMYVAIPLEYAVAEVIGKFREGSNKNV